MDGRYVDVDGIKTYYIEQGKGSALVLFHGGAVGVTAESAFFRQIEGLSDQFRVIAFDQYCFGRTDMPKDGKLRNRLARVDHALAFLKAIGVSRAALAGHSEGGFMVVKMALENPDLVSHLIIMCSGGTAPVLGGDADKAWVDAATKAYSYYSDALTEDQFVEVKRRGYRVFDSRLEQIIRANYRRAVETGEAEIFRHLPIEETDQFLFTKLQKVHLEPYLDQIKCPTMLIWASDDATVPVARGVKLREQLPHADFHVLANSGHPVMHDRADGVNDLLRSFCSK
ncbi:MAG: alpha/beta fold hydrolase [Pseudorhodoplanes sp.]